MGLFCLYTLYTYKKNNFYIFDKWLNLLYLIFCLDICGNKQIINK